MKKTKQKAYVYLFMMIFSVYPINGRISRVKGKRQSTTTDLLWAKLYGRGSLEGDAQPELWAKIDEGSYIKRICVSCKKRSHQSIIYKRLTPKGTTTETTETNAKTGTTTETTETNTKTKKTTTITSTTTTTIATVNATSIDFSKLFLSDWFSKPSSDAENVIGVDFNLYSTFDDAENNLRPWSFCNYDDPGIGFPRDCGPTEDTNHEWNSMTRGGETDFAYYLYDEGEGEDEESPQTSAFYGAELKVISDDKCMYYDSHGGMYSGDCDGSEKTKFDYNPVTGKIKATGGNKQGQCLLADGWFWPKIRPCDGKDQQNMEFTDGKIKTAANNKCLTYLNGTTRLHFADCVASGNEIFQINDP